MLFVFCFQSNEKFFRINRFVKFTLKLSQPVADLDIRHIRTGECQNLDPSENS